ncbi:MAG: ATP-dependent DNA helicase, partial [Candidatus Tantalella remota]|nr:ATP-dependent DNA helicase [Candidatus Tantalella remota]
MDNFSKHYNKLNDEQKKAVDLTDGPLLVLAGPGTGKTQLLSVRAANIIRSGKCDPENILILTFTNAAARAMRERLANILGQTGYSVEVETFHSFANSIVLESIEAIDYVKDKIELGDVEKTRAIKYILDNVKGAGELRPFGAPYIHRNEIEKRIGELKNEGILPLEFKELTRKFLPDGKIIDDKDVSRLRALAVIYEHYERLKTKDAGLLFDERGRIDYDDMLLVALEALNDNIKLCDFFREQYKYVMVDEYQDTNGVQLDLLFSIIDPKTKNICCVGDDDQSIYRFQGATLSNFRVLAERIPSLKKISLVDNYRSSEDIIKVSGDIIGQLPDIERVDTKKLKPCVQYSSGGIRAIEFSTEEEELDFLAEEVARMAKIIAKDKLISLRERKQPYNNMAVLTRTRAQINRVVDMFLKKGIPYATDGKENIRNEKRVRQMLDVLELVNIDPGDMENKSLILYNILTSDYIKAKQQDILRFIGHVSRMRSHARSKGDLKKYCAYNLFQEFMVSFPAEEEKPPSKKDSDNLKITKDIKLEDAHTMHLLAWSLGRALRDSQDRPVHDILLRYIEDTCLYKFVLKTYCDNRILKARDLRALVSFVNMVKSADMAKPALSLREFMEEIELREVQGMPVRGELATMNQDGVRVYTAHGSKGLEFYSVFMPFCLDKKSWPYRGKADIINLPPEVYKNKERVEEKKKLKILRGHDELRIFYVASTRAKAYLTYTSTPAGRAITTPFFAQSGLLEENVSSRDEQEFYGRFLTKKEREYDPSGVTSAILEDMVRDIAMTPTKLNTYLNCPRKFLYNYVLSLPGRKNQHLVFGNCAHKALEEVYGSFMDKKRFPPFLEFKREFKKELDFQGVNDS